MVKNVVQSMLVMVNPIISTALRRPGSIVEFIRNHHERYSIALALCIGPALSESVHDVHELLLNPFDVLGKQVAELNLACAGSRFDVFFEASGIFLGQAGGISHHQSQARGGGLLDRFLIRLAVAAGFLTRIRVDDVFAAGSSLAFDGTYLMIDDLRFLKAIQGEMKRPRSSAGDCTDFRCGARSAIHQGENNVPARKAGNGFQSLVGPKKPVFESLIPILNGLWAFMRSGDFRSCAVVFL